MLVAEMWASRLLGQIWVTGWADDAAGDTHDPNDVMENQVEAFIHYLAGQSSAVALTILRALALVGEDWMRDLATMAARGLAGRGIPEPAWAAHSGTTELIDALSTTDMFGDVEVITLVFRRAAIDHVVVVFVDHASLAGIFKIMVGEMAADNLTALVTAFGPGGSLSDPISLTAAQARARLDDALDRMLDHGPPEAEYIQDAEYIAADRDGVDDRGSEDDEDDEDDDPAGTWALLRARLDLLPDDAFAGTGATDADMIVIGGSDVNGSDLDLADDGADRAEAERVVMRFLATDRAKALPDRDAARIWARMAADWALDLGRAAQHYGPLSLGYFLITEVSQHITIGDDDLTLLPAVIRAWAHFTADARGLGAIAHQQWDEQLADVLDQFASAYKEPGAVEHRATCADVIAFRLYETETSSEALFDRLYASAPTLMRGQLDAARLALDPLPPPAAAAAGTVYRVKVLLRGSKPPIWRRLEISSMSTLTDLHKVIQAAFDWNGDHLWVFTTDYGQFGYSSDLGDQDPDSVTLAQIATEGTTFRYLFDFGDNLDHNVIVERTLLAATGTAYPRCVGGRQPDPALYYFDDDDEGRTDAVFDKELINARLARLQT
ncbi:plasmid pRiA4b ORF-3 family protein [Frankia sp. CiP3]|uniref:plasmid pRiA4b ORF-3 family protein n=1 Tax=Frankia sp. CiP3 TaxID=2880971 RepID=UPI001EF5B744|nr:plasmid pRiA4b ORF-3 family protein [Frankia sp. CiP3]